MSGTMGKIEGINISGARGTRKDPVMSAKLIEGFGIEGDAHAGDWHRQISLLGDESVDKMRALGIKNLTHGAFAENITTSGIDLKNIKVGKTLAIGECIIAVTQIGKECHNDGCAISKAAGMCVMPTDGIFAVVVKGGEIHIGDEIYETD